MENYTVLYLTYSYIHSKIFTESHSQTLCSVMGIQKQMTWTLLLNSLQGHLNHARFNLMSVIKIGIHQVPGSSSKIPACNLWLDLGSQFKRRDGLLGQSEWRRLQKAWFWQGLLVTKVPSGLRRRGGAPPFWSTNCALRWGGESQWQCHEHRIFGSPPWWWEAAAADTHTYLMGISSYSYIMLSCSMTEDFALTGAAVGSGPSSCWLCVVRRRRHSWRRWDVIHCRFG